MATVQWSGRLAFASAISHYPVSFPGVLIEERENHHFFQVAIVY